MNDYGRRIVIDLGFESAVGAATHAMRDEGLEVVARVDVREHFRRDLRHDFRQYVLLDAWPADAAFEALQTNLDIGTILRTTFAVYELADGETAIAASEPLLSVASDPGWRHDAVILTPIADRIRVRVARVLTRLQHAASQPASMASVA